MTKWDVLRLIGKSFSLGIRVAAIIPVAWYHRNQALVVFNRELRHNHIPAAVRRELGAHYRAMLPLNPLQYRRSPTHSRTLEDRCRIETHSKLGALNLPSKVGDPKNIIS